MHAQNDRTEILQTWLPEKHAHCDKKEAGFQMRSIASLWQQFPCEEM